MKIEFRRKLAQGRSAQYRRCCRSDAHPSLFWPGIGMSAIIITAYAIAPDRGSEPGVGWNWVLTLARAGHRVTVLTRFEHHEIVSREIDRGTLPELQLVVPIAVGIRSVEEAVRGRGLLIYPYVMLWQAFAAVKAWRLHRRTPFQIAHHLTYGGIRIPSFLGFLSCTTIIGPLGGGEHAPWRLIRPFGFKALMLEAVRYIGNLTNYINPLIHLSFFQSDHILVRTPETTTFVPRWYRNKVRIVPDVGIDVNGWMSAENHHRVRDILFVGRFLYWKGGEALLRAFSTLAARGGTWTLTMVGDGPQRENWRQLATKLAIADRIVWTGKVPQSSLVEVYKNHKLFVFPSLHDAGANAVLEAMACRTPVLCLDLGAPGAMAAEAGGVAIATSGRSMAEVETALADAMEAILKNPSRREQLGKQAYAFAVRRTWKACVNDAYNGVSPQSAT